MYQHLGTFNTGAVPELRQVVLAAVPKYRKHKITAILSDKVTLSGTYWSGGSRSTYVAVDLATGRAGSAPQYNPPQFGGPSADPTVDLPPGVAVVQCGVFCGKPATATVYIHPDNVSHLLPS